MRIKKFNQINENVEQAAEETKARWDKFRKDIILPEKQAIVIRFITEHSSSIDDLKWKLNKYAERGDVSFLGHSVSELMNLVEAVDVVEEKPTATLRAPGSEEDTK